MVIKEFTSAFLISVTLLCIFLLTGCPGQGDRFRFDETTQVKLIDGNVCFPIINVRDYQPAIISINPRGTPSKQQTFIDNALLLITDEKLCIPPSFHHFEDNRKYIVEFVLHSTQSHDEPRSFVVGIGVNNNKVYNFPLTGREFSRPYGSIQVSE